MTSFLQSAATTSFNPETAAALVNPLLHRDGPILQSTRPLGALSPVDWFALLPKGAPPWFGAPALRIRDLARALSMIIPGNAAIGSGGGIMRMAARRGGVAPLPPFPAVAFTVSAVQITVVLLGQKTKKARLCRPAQAATSIPSAFSPA